MIDLRRLPRVDLAALQMAADLQTRLDLKYLVDLPVLQDVIDVLGPELAALEMNGARDFAYESVYFDTPGFESYLGSAHGRRRRFKVRTRSYVDSGDCVLELKSAGGRGQTVKARHPYSSTDRHVLTAEARAFLNEFCLPQQTIDSLRPTLTTTYRRTTLLGLGFRCTLDVDIRCVDTGGSESHLLGDKVLLESKSINGSVAIDHALWSRGVRPLSISKYCTGLAALHPELPSNKWHRTLLRHFSTTTAATHCSCAER